jgi:methenyltetrahydromethanopterin cyclohydrolase
MLHLNRRARSLCDRLVAEAESLGVRPQRLPCGTLVVDCGIDEPGGREAGILLARVCLADLAEVEVTDEDPATDPWPAVRVTTQQPIAACLASQYAGWEVKGDRFFAMGSGPMRTTAAREPLFQEPLLAELAGQETSVPSVGILEAAQLPPEEVCLAIADRCHIGPAELTLLVAPTSSQAGTLQVVARSVETALHKLHELDFDLGRIASGQGIAPLPPPARDDLAAIGRTNDAILYGSRVTLEVHGDDPLLQAIGPQTPSSASVDHGRPFAEVLAQYNNDFYQIDPLLFSPAELVLENLDTGNSFTFGSIKHTVLAESFGTPRKT